MARYAARSLPANGSRRYHDNGHDHGVQRVSTRTIKASEFKAKCLALMDEVRDTADTITITKNGEPVAELRAAKRPRKSLWGLHAGRIEIRGDLDESVYEMWMRDQ